MRAIVVSSLVAGAAFAGALVAGERSARACGGCFHVPTPMETTVVTDHRMAFSVSTQQTVLWDQIKYSGNPSDFAWVLPVKQGAAVQLSHDEWFAALDAVTQPVITGPTPNCGGGGGPGIGCGASAGGGAALSASGGGSSVQVVNQSTVGPYDTVTLRSTDPSALVNWLDSHSYAIPDSIRPTIDAYVAGGFDFIALRLQPGQGVQAMQPVRVVTPGSDATLPLRMVAAGVGANVGITLYVIGEGRYEAQNFPNVIFDDSKLAWDPKANASNYQPLSQQLMAQANGRTWLTEYANPTGVEPTNTAPYCYGGGGPGGLNVANPTNVGDVYLAQCTCLQSGTGQDASTSGGCAGFDDYDVALVGMHVTDTWVTRMRAVLPVSALSEGDMLLQASATQAEVSNLHTTNNYTDPTYSPCGTTGGCSASDADPDAYSRWVVAGALGFVVVSLARRKRSRASSH